MGRKELEKTLDKALTDREDEELFRQAVKGAFELGLVTEKSLGHEMGAPFFVILRWRDGISAPHPAMRPAIYRFLKGLLTAQAG